MVAGAYLLTSPALTRSAMTLVSCTPGERCEDHLAQELPLQPKRNASERSLLTKRRTTPLLDGRRFDRVGAIGMRRALGVRRSHAWSRRRGGRRAGREQSEEGAALAMSSYERMMTPPTARLGGDSGSGVGDANRDASAFDAVVRMRGVLRVGWFECGGASGAGGARVWGRFGCGGTRCCAIGGSRALAVWLVNASPV